MGKTKISLIQLERLVREGKGVSQIARELSVTKGSVSKKLKNLRVGITKDVALRSASKIVDRQLNAMDQLKRINCLINNELDYIEKNIVTAKGERRKELQEQRLKHVAEVRKQLSLLLDIAQALYNAEEVAKFQHFVLEEIGRAAPEIRDQIIQRLNEARVIQSTIGFGQPGI
jgi:DNA-binding phage protein